VGVLDLTQDSNRTITESPPLQDDASIGEISPKTPNEPTSKAAVVPPTPVSVGTIGGTNTSFAPTMMYRLPDGQVVPLNPLGPADTYLPPNSSTMYGVGQEHFQKAFEETQKTRALLKKITEDNEALKKQIDVLEKCEEKHKDEELEKVQNLVDKAEGTPQKKSFETCLFVFFLFSRNKKCLFVCLFRYHQRTHGH
jgi:hypothetical protein